MSTQVSSAELSEVEEIYDLLQDHRILVIFIGLEDENGCIKLPRSLLNGRSAVLDSALKKARIPGEDDAYVRFAEDEVTSWKALLYWLYRHKTPEALSTNLLLAVRAWRLGTKCDLLEFYDDIMMTVLNSCQDKKYEKISIDLLWEVFPIGPLPEPQEPLDSGDAMQELVMEELLIEMKGDNSDQALTFDELDKAFGKKGPKGENGCMPLFIRKEDDAVWKNGYFLNRWKNRFEEVPQEKGWKGYLMQSERFEKHQFREATIRT